MIINYFTGGCQFCYSKQPPVSPSDCNPYAPSSIRLVCQVTGPSGAALEIKWYSRSDDGQETLLNDDGEHVTSGHAITVNSEKTITSYLTIMKLTVGSYWCRVFHNNNGLLASQMFGVAGVDDYERESNCEENKTFAEEIAKCADIPIPDHLAGKGTSSSCPLNDAASTIVSVFATRTLIPSTTIAQNSYQPTTLPMSPTLVLTAGNNESSTSNPSPSASQIATDTSSSVEVLPTVRPSNDPAAAAVHDKQRTETWLYLVVGLSGTFLFLIVILLGICVLLCLTRPSQRSRKGKITVSENYLGL